ncbi:uncharacterized protein LOC119576614 [Penaeus monodon]|uniref:uncharacterized protein LOC119576614 n=1 Tax=Penaeus monodon TaxID=6687 RepID=UPI0018A6FB22|nr:uncharacterized protein LOC119576614 [Penaeus monodon]
MARNNHDFSRENRYFELGLCGRAESNNRSLLRRLMLILQACLVVAAMAETWQQKYDSWASNLKPGWTIQTTIQDGRKCYCKMPNETVPFQSSFGGFISSGNLASVESVKSSFEHVFLTPP